MLEGVQAGGREDANLSHRAAEHPAVTQRRIDQGARAGQERSAWCTEPLRERNRDQIEWRGELRRRMPARDGRVPEPGPIQITGDTVFTRGAANPAPLVLRKDDSSRPVVSVLDLDAGRGRKQHVPARIARREELLGGENAAGADLGQLDAGVRACTARLVPYRMRLPTNDDVVPGARQYSQRHLIGHRPCGQPERGLLAQERRDAILQLVDGRILTELIVAHRSGRDRLSHRGGVTGDRIGTKINWKRHCVITTRGGTETPRKIFVFLGASVPLCVGFLQPSLNSFQGCLLMNSSTFALKTSGRSQYVECPTSGTITDSAFLIRAENICNTAGGA